MKEINFITIGDKNFFPLIQFSIKQVLKFYPTAKLFIYDWGFIPPQKKKISTYPNTILIDWTDKLDREHGYKNIKVTHKRDVLINVPSKREYILNQKPICMLDCAKRVKENLIFFDGDAILINPIDEIFEDNKDIGLTASDKFLTEYGNRWKFMVNSGIIFFTLDSKRMQKFIQEWIKEIEVSNSIISEQTSLFNLIRKRKEEIVYKGDNIVIIKLANLKYKIKIYPTRIYNCAGNGLRYNDKKVKFLHLILMKRHYLMNHHYPKDLRNSIIIREYIREMKIRYAFYHILKLGSPILSSKIKKNIKEIFNHFLIFKLLIRPLNFNLIAYFLLSVYLNIRKKMKKRIL